VKFLSREDTLSHFGFEFLINNVNYKAKNGVYKPYTSVEIFTLLLNFDERISEKLDKAFIQGLYDKMEE
jgi:hypothetical protein